MIINRVYSSVDKNFIDKFILTKKTIEKYNISDKFTVLCTDDETYEYNFGSIDKIRLEDLKNNTYQAEPNRFLNFRAALELGEIISNSDDNKVMVVEPGILFKYNIYKLILNNNFKKINLSSSYKNLGYDQLIQYFAGDFSNDNIALFRVMDTSLITDELFRDISKTINNNNLNNILPSNQVIFGTNENVANYYKTFLDFYNKNKKFVDHINSNCVPDGKFPPEVFNNVMLVFNIIYYNHINLLNQKSMNFYSHSMVEHEFVKQILNEDNINDWVNIACLFMRGYLERIDEYYKNIQ